MMKRQMLVPFLALLSGATFAQGAPTRILSLDELYRLATDNSRQLKVLASGIEAAEAATDVASSARLPKLNVSASASYLGDVQIISRDFSSITNVTIPHFGNSFAVEASQVLYAGGAISGTIEKSHLEAKLAHLSYEKNQQEVRYLLAGIYLDLWKLGNERKVYAKNLEEEKILVRQMEDRLQAGTALKNDVVRHELRLQDMTLALLRLDNNRTVLNDQLVTLLGLPTATVVEPDTTLLAPLPTAPTTEDLQRTADKFLPELQIADLKENLAAKDVGIAKASYLPTVALFAGDALNGPITFEIPTIDKNINDWYVGISLKYEISSLYTANRTLRLARAQQEGARRARDLAREQASLAIRSGLVKYRESFDELKVLEKGCEYAEANYAVVSERYAGGVVLITEMMDASNSRLDAELKLANARINTVFQSLNLKRLSGTL